MDNLTNEEILERFPLFLRDNILQIWTKGKIGVSSMNLKINLFPRKSNYDYNLNTCTNFLIEIPYAGRQLHWEVFFDDNEITFPPDFDFVNDHFLSNPDVEIITEHIPGLLKWDVKNPNAFLTVIKELMALYKIYQLRRLEGDPKYSNQFGEYLLLKQELNISDEEIEVYIDSTSVHFLIALVMDFTSLPIYIQKSYFEDDSVLLNPNEDTATLGISFVGNRTTTYLQLSPGLENAVGGSKSLHIPPYTKDTKMNVYVELILKLLKDKIEQIKQQYEMKQEYISAVLSLYGLNIIEYDNVDFSKALILCEVDGFYCLVQINLTNKFPQQKPSIAIRSVYHQAYDKPVFLELEHYPYSPRWKPDEMVKRLFEKIVEEIPIFKVSCINKS